MKRKKTCALHPDAHFAIRAFVDELVLAIQHLDVDFATKDELKSIMRLLSDTLVVMGITPAYFEYVETQCINAMHLLPLALQLEDPLRLAKLRTVLQTELANYTF